MSETYIGGELELFSYAKQWKKYWQSRLSVYVSGAVLEVGGGLGANTPFFAAHANSLLVIEPDPALAQTIATNAVGLNIQVQNTTIEKIPQTFDAIFYIDVLEHIEHDDHELSLAAEKLNKHGIICVLAPAHQSLFSPFDRSVGHWRRYNKKSLSRLAPEGTRIHRIFYLDSVGLAASFANRCLLKQSMPTHKQIRLWDSIMIPLSRIMDPILGHCFGKTVIAVYAKI